MPKDLIIVESPAKVKTIKKFLGAGFEVEASVGHVRDLPSKTIGVDEDAGFLPNYEIIPGKQKVVAKLMERAAKAGKVYLAPDPDREGEAIAWHVAEILKNANANIERIQFNEITPKAVKEALDHPRRIDDKLFASQQARRILDRLVGYKMSPLLWNKVKRGISAGRVQSVALRLIVDREAERNAFVPEEYWLFKVLLEGQAKAVFPAELAKLDGKKADISSAGQAEAAEAAMRANPFVVSEVKEKKRKKTPPPPFITSTLQQAANQRLGYSAKKTMGAAQKLYEGVDLGERGTTALITYMRTDSVRLSDDAMDMAKEYIVATLGENYYPAKPRKFKTKGSAQDAHEAIRPIDASLTPAVVKSYLPADQFQVYKLVWERFVASQMAEAEFHDTTVSIDNGPAQWRAKGERLLFPGYLQVYGQQAVDEESVAAEGTEAPVLAKGMLPKLAKGEVLSLKELTKDQKFTQPPPRYSEASLVRELEEKGIGRPSTYAAIISTLQDREYVRLAEKHFIPSELGKTVSELLTAHFSTIMDVGFTAHMEQELDEVAEGKVDWQQLLSRFVADFNPTLAKAVKDMKAVKAGRATDIPCPECGKPMLVKFGKMGEFLACSDYPGCKATAEFTTDAEGKIHLAPKRADEETGVVCPDCGKAMKVKVSKWGEFLACTGYPDCRTTAKMRRTEEGIEPIFKSAEAVQKVGTCPQCQADLLLKVSRFGSRFISCANYPKCKYSKPFSSGIPCPREGCEGELVEKATRFKKLYYSCSRYPDCDEAIWGTPVQKPCPACGHKVMARKTTKAKGEHLACPKDTCKYTEPVTE